MTQQPWSGGHDQIAVTTEIPRPGKPSRTAKIILIAVGAFVVVAAAGGIAAKAISGDRDPKGTVVGQPVQVAPAPATTPGGPAPEPAASDPAANASPADTAAGSGTTGNSGVPSVPGLDLGDLGLGLGSGLFSEDYIKNIALSQVPGAGSIRLRLSQDGGRPQYEGEIIDGSTKYEFEIDATTGEVLSWNFEHVNG
ncbi:MAG: PepSY domain-containing protein [Bifidobacteriaceae bacterium]|jgi:uncharacterized membrane protein YkoI|nr:PepSY domain-containing protein [Bifidobacteriaceae bacterium]